MADWTIPGLNSNYSTALTNLKDRDVDAATLGYAAPTTPPTGMMKYVRASNKFQEWDGNNWNDKILAVAGGGTGGNNAADARTNLGIGSMGTQANNAVNITGGNISGITSFNISGNFSAGGTIQTTAASNDALKSGGGITLNDVAIYRIDSSNLSMGASLRLYQAGIHPTFLLSADDGYQPQLRLFQANHSDWYIYCQINTSELRILSSSDKFVLNTAGNGNFVGSLQWGGGSAIPSSNNISLTTHNHAGVYAANDHNHTGVYAANSHTHTEYYANNATLNPSANNTYDLGGANYFRDLYLGASIRFVPPNTNSADRPLVWSSTTGWVYMRNNAVNDNLQVMTGIDIDFGGNSFTPEYATITFEGGICMGV